MKKYTTILCLTLITITDLIFSVGFVSFSLWVGYGLYKLETQL